MDVGGGLLNRGRKERWKIHLLGVGFKNVREVPASYDQSHRSYGEKRRGRTSDLVATPVWRQRQPPVDEHGLTRELVNWHEGVARGAIIRRPGSLGMVKQRMSDRLANKGRRR